jgi:hypothetical protein
VITASARRKPGQPGRGHPRPVSLLRLLAEWEQGIADTLLTRAGLDSPGESDRLRAVAIACEARTGCTWTSGPMTSKRKSNGFIRAGARRVDIGQGKPTWVVLADPEGNEFCVLAAPRA